MGVLRWLMLASHVPPGGTGGGIVRYTVEFTRALRHQPDVEVHVVASRAARDWWVEQLGSSARVHVGKGWQHDRGSNRRHSDVSGAGQVPAGVAFDVVHSAQHLLPPPMGALRVLTVHDMLPLDRPAETDHSEALRLRGPYLESIREADLIVCVSAASRSRMLAYVPTARNRSLVIPLAAAPAVTQAASEPVAGLPPGRFVLAVGDGTPRKNLALLTRCWPEVTAHVPDAVLVFAGPPGRGKPAATADMTQLERAGSLKRLGLVSDAHLRWCYENAAVVAIPSLLEGFGLPVAEALAFGAPVLVSDDPALVEAGDGVVTVLPSDRPQMWSRALVEALAVPRRASGDHSVAPVRTWDDVARETVEAVARRGHRGGLLHG